MATYSFDNAWVDARRRLSLLESISDGGTIRQLTARQIEPGWACLEVGGGGGSIAAWLCEQVGPGGRVVATDIDTRFLEALANPNLEVLRHDILTDDLPEVTFDLVHARAVIAHLGNRDRAIRQLIGALKPGGWLVLEEPDFLTVQGVTGPAPDSTALFQKVHDARMRVMAARGFDFYYGRQLYSELRSRGLDDVGSEGHVTVAEGGGAWAEFFTLNVLQLHEQLVASGLATNAEVEGYLRLLQDPAFVAIWTTAFAAWGRKPRG